MKTKTLDEHLVILTNEKTKKRLWITYIKHVSRKIKISYMENTENVHCGFDLA